MIGVYFLDEVAKVFNFFLDGRLQQLEVYFKSGLFAREMHCLSGDARSFGAFLEVLLVLDMHVDYELVESEVGWSLLICGHIFIHFVGLI